MQLMRRGRHLGPANHLHLEGLFKILNGVYNEDSRSLLLLREPLGLGLVAAENFEITIWKRPPGFSIQNKERYTQKIGTKSGCRSAHRDAPPSRSEKSNAAASEFVNPFLASSMLPGFGALKKVTPCTQQGVFSVSWE
jgi:hypothetical protein